MRAIGERSRSRPGAGARRLPGAELAPQDWTSDEDGARAAAQERLDRSSRASRPSGIEARGEVGDADPLVGDRGRAARRSARRDRHLDPPRGRSNWLERGVVAAVRERFDVPVTHVVVDLGAGRIAGAA